MNRTDNPYRVSLLSTAMNPSNLVRRSFLRGAALTLAAAAAGILAGCGSTTKVQTQQSVGQQLSDLEKSYKDGVITQKEYERLKKAIIRNND